MRDWFDVKLTVNLKQLSGNFQLTACLFKLGVEVSLSKMSGSVHLKAQRDKPFQPIGRPHNVWDNPDDFDSDELSKVKTRGSGLWKKIAIGTAALVITAGAIYAFGLIRLIMF